MFLVNHNLGYRALIMSPKDFVLFSELLDRATLVDSRCLNGKTIWVNDEDRAPASGEMFKGAVVSKEEFEVLKAQEETS